MVADWLQASVCQHAVESGAPDGDLCLLSRKGSGPQASSDRSLVSPDGGFDQRTLTVAGGRLPFQPTVSWTC